LSEILYKLNNIQTSYNTKPILNIHALQINQSEILGLIGSNGSGKSTLLRHLAFLESPLSGELLYKGFSHQLIPLHVKREITILLPEPTLLKRSVKENLLFGLKLHDDMENAQKRMEEVLELVGLLPKKFLQRQWHELSSGETQRVCLAARLILKPKTLLLDEPTNSLDYNGVPIFSDAISYANQQWKTTVIIASHDLLWLSSLATRQVGLHFGRVMDFSTSNFIFGKWEEKGKNKIFHFGDDQHLQIPKEWRVGEKRGIAINPRKISLTKEIFTCKEKLFFLEGFIKEISHLQKDDEVSLKINVGEYTIEAIMDYEEFKKNSFSLREKVVLSFSQEAFNTN
jgi:tungstate transport system ATP-binding protein